MPRVTKYIFTRMIVVKFYIKLQKETKKVNNQTTSPLIQDCKIDYLIEPTVEYTKKTQITATKTPQVALFV